MPVYCLQCPNCKNKWEDVHGMREPHPQCPCCGKAQGESDPVRQGLPRKQREFFGMGRLSLQFGFDPSEAKEANEMFAGTGATIDAEGDVYFDNRSQEKAFRKRYAEKWQAAERERDRLSAGT